MCCACTAQGKSFADLASVGHLMPAHTWQSTWCETPLVLLAGENLWSCHRIGKPNPSVKSYDGMHTVKMAQMCSSILAPVTAQGVLSFVLQNLLISAVYQAFACREQHCITTANGAPAHLDFAGCASTVDMLHQPCLTSLHLPLDNSCHAVQCSEVVSQEACTGSVSLVGQLCTRMSM